MTRTDAESDLAYLRDLAEAGARAPQLGGRFLVWWGGLVAATMLVHYAIYMGFIAGPPWSLAGLWIGFGIVGSLGQALLFATIRDKPGLGSAGNRVEKAVWIAVNFALIAYVAGVVVGAASGRLEMVFFNTILPVALLGYGIAWTTIAQIARARLFYLPGAAALIGAAACVLLVLTAEVYLAAAATAIVAAVLPGLVMLAREPRTTV